MSKLEERVVRFSPSRGAHSPDVWGIYEPDTGSVQYICADPATRKAALIDVVWNFDPNTTARARRASSRFSNSPGRTVSRWSGSSTPTRMPTT